jgi:hypothetical protein
MTLGMEKMLDNSRDNWLTGSTRVRCGVSGLICTRTLLLAIITNLSACYYETRITGQDPADLVDWPEAIGDAAKAGQADQAAVEAQLHSGTATPYRIEPDSDVAVEIQKAFHETTKARQLLLLRRQNNNVSSGSLFERVRSEIVVEGVFHRLSPSILPVATDEPFAATFSDGTILLSTRFANGLIADGIPANYWALRVVTAHELVHFYDGHILFAWIASEGRHKYVPRAFLTALSQVTSRLPLSFSYQYAPSESYSSLSKLPSLFEFLADYWSYYIVREMGAPTGVVSQTLFAMRDANVYTKVPGQPVKRIELLDARAKCMTLLDSATPLDARLRLIPLGSIQYVGTPENLNTLLHQAVHDEYPRKSLSDAQVDELVGQMIYVLRASSDGPSDIREANLDDAYWACAVQALVPDNDQISGKTPSLFRLNDATQIRELFNRMALGPGGAVHANRPLVYVDEVEGLALTEAGDTYRTPRPDMRPHLLLTYATYEGFADGFHKIRIRIENRGHTASTRPILITSQREGSSVFLGHCGERRTNTDTCTRVVLTKSIGPEGRGEYFDIYVPGPAAPRRSQRLIKFTVNGCTTPAGEAADPSDVSCPLRGSISDGESKFIKIGIFPRVSIGNLGMPYGTDDGSKFAFSVSNSGTISPTVPFEITAALDGAPVAISLCDPKKVAVLGSAECDGVWIQEPFQPTAWKSFAVFLRNPKAIGPGNHRIVFSVGGCLPQPDVDDASPDSCGEDETADRYVARAAESFTIQ